MAEDTVEGADEAKHRLFLAVALPPPVRDAVANAIGPWRDAFPDARWVPAENWHVTLKFLGSTPAHLVPWVEETVEPILAVHAKVTVRARGLGAFPSTRRARVLWAGIEDHANGLNSLVADLESGLTEEFPPEAGPFHPHLTVARPDPPLGLPDPYVDTPLASEMFVVGRVVLFRSHLQGRSPRYEPLRTFPLHD